MDIKTVCLFLCWLPERSGARGLTMLVTLVCGHCCNRLLLRGIVQVASDLPEASRHAETECFCCMQKQTCASQAPFLSCTIKCASSTHDVSFQRLSDADTLYSMPLREVIRQCKMLVRAFATQGKQGCMRKLYHLKQLEAHLQVCTASVALSPSMLYASELASCAKRRWCLT